MSPFTWNTTEILGAVLDRCPEAWVSLGNLPTPAYATRFLTLSLEDPLLAGDDRGEFVWIRGYRLGLNHNTGQTPDSMDIDVVEVTNALGDVEALLPQDSPLAGLYAEVVSILEDRGAWVVPHVHIDDTTGRATLPTPESDD